MKFSAYRVKSVSNFQSTKKNSHYHKDNDQKKLQNSLIQNLLHRRSVSTKKMFTDQTQYTYRPQINDLPSEIYPSTGSEIQISKQKIFERLIRNLKQKQEHFRLVKLQQDKQKLRQNCTFKPQVTQASKKMAQQKRLQQGTDKQSAFERLYYQALQKQKITQNSLQTVNYERQKENLTFQPEINPISKIINAQKSPIDPIHKRLNEIINKKRENQKAIQQKHIQDIENQTKFKVENPVTLKILQNNSNFTQQTKGNNVVRRLLDNYFYKKNQKQTQIIKQKESRFNQQCTFKPIINDNALLNSSNQIQQDFIQRQKQHQQTTKQNIKARANQFIPTFRPQINKISQLLTRDRQNQTFEQKVHRLNYQSLFEKQQKMQQLQTSLYKQCTFHPKINTISKILQSSPQMHKCNCIHPQQKYNFRPQINAKSRKLAQKASNPNLKSTKNQKINKIKMQKQYKQLTQCTFQPKTKQLKKQMLQQYCLKDVVNGAKQFVEKAQALKLRKIQNQLYKQKIFNLEKRYDSKQNKTTKIQQFHIKKTQQTIIKRLKTQAEDRFAKQCTFKPKIGKTTNQLPGQTWRIR